MTKKDLPAEPVKSEDKTIEGLLIHGQLEEALARIGEVNRAAREQAELWVSFNSQLNAYREAFERGDIEYEEFQRHKNRISQAVLGLVQGMTKAIQPYFHFYTSNPLNDIDSDHHEELLVYLSTRLDGKYEIYPRPLGKGNSCIVFKIRDLYSGRYEVLRVLKTAHLKGLEEEVSQVCRLKHRNIMSVHEIYFKEFPYFVTTEYVPSESLDVYLDRYGRRPFFEVRDMVLRLGDALRYLRDKKIFLAQVRPSKILLDTENQPVISPFEVIKASDATRAKEKVKEDALYLAPERLENESAEPDIEAAGQADQYSLGLLMYELLAGQPLFAGIQAPEPTGGRRRFEEVSLVRIFKNRARFYAPRDTFRRDQFAVLNMANVPKAIQPVLQRLLEHDPARRYPTFEEALEAIARIDPGWTSVQRTVMESFQRCLRSNTDFVGNFYQKVRHDNHFPAEFIQFSDIEQQQKMFRGVVTLLVEAGNRHPIARHLSRMKGHQGLNTAHYRTFLDLLIGTVEETDSYWPQKPGIKAAWEELAARLLGEMGK